MDRAPFTCTWHPQPEADALVARLVRDLTPRHPLLADLEHRLPAATGTRLIDWIDHLVVPEHDPAAARFAAVGFRPAPILSAEGSWAHPDGRFPTLHLGASHGCGLLVESVAEAIAALGIDAPIDGPPGSPIRRVLVPGPHAALILVERHGAAGLHPLPAGPAAYETRQLIGERLLCRRRHFASPDEGFAHAQRLITEAVQAVGTDLACDLFFTAERRHWERRCPAGSRQRARQDRLGLGWANHDHHTYRSSRRHFAELIRCLEALGMRCRERFHAGAEAGWGAQVLEQPATGLVVFADVDLSPGELAEDFPHAGLKEQGHLGTVGLWCALHGEAFLAAGLHHLAILGDFDALMTGLVQESITSMPPFTAFPHLKQCFTTASSWPVDIERGGMLAQSGQISLSQAERFADQGALGSHLELIERNLGFKGFNQRGVSEVILATDPRR